MSAPRPPCRCGRSGCASIPTNGACANQFDATVEELIYLGDHTRARVQLLRHNNFVIKVPNSEGVPNLAPGATIRIGWRAEDCRALDAF